MPRQHLPAVLALEPGLLLTRDELRLAGLNGDLGDRLHRAGAWDRPAPSTYLLSAGPHADDALVAAALAHAGADAVITGSVACRAWGIPDAGPTCVVDVLVPARRRRVSTGTIRVLPTTRPPSYAVIEGVRYAEPHRAVIDAARRLDSLRDVRALLTAAVCSKRCEPAGLSSELEAGAKGGSALVRRAVQDVLIGARSAPEAEVADTVRVSGALPPFLLNPSLLVDGVLVGEPDGWFLGLGLGWEVDSVRHHGDSDDLDATLERHDRFAAYGLALLHVTPARARRLGVGYARLIGDAVTARRTAALPEPAGLVVRLRGPLQVPRTARASPRRPPRP